MHFWHFLPIFPLWLYSVSLIFLLASCPSFSPPHNRWKILYEEHFYLQKWFILEWVLACCILFYPDTYLSQFMLSYTLRSSKAFLRLSSLTTVSFGPREICYASILLLFCNNADNYYLKTLPNLLQLGLIKDWYKQTLWLDTCVY